MQHNTHPQLTQTSRKSWLSLNLRLSNPEEGILPEALVAMPDVALKTLNINLSELIRHLPGKHATYASKSLTDMVRFQGQDDAWPDRALLNELLKGNGEKSC